MILSFPIFGMLYSFCIIFPITRKHNIIDHSICNILKSAKPVINLKTSAQGAKKIATRINVSILTLKRIIQNEKTNIETKTILIIILVNAPNNMNKPNRIIEMA